MCAFKMCFHFYGILVLKQWAMIKKTLLYLDINDVTVCISAARGECN